MRNLVRKSPVAEPSGYNCLDVSGRFFFIVSSERWQIVKGKSAWAARPETSSLVGWVKIGSSEDFFQSVSPLTTLGRKKITRREKIIEIRRKPIKRLEMISEKLIKLFHFKYFLWFMRPSKYLKMTVLTARSQFRF